MKQIENGNEFLNLIFKDMKDMIKGNKTPVEKISAYLEKLETIHDEAIKDKHKMDLLKRFYYQKYIIKEVPESYIKYEKEYIRQLGFNSDLTEEQKQIVLNKIQEKQKRSLDNWINFLCSEKTEYPTWFKYYVFRGMIRLRFFYDWGTFAKRSKSTTDEFLEIDTVVIDEMYEVLSKVIQKAELSELEQKIISSGMDFNNLYRSVYWYYTNRVFVREDGAVSRIL